MRVADEARHRLLATRLHISGEGGGREKRRVRASTGTRVAPSRLQPHLLNRDSPRVISYAASPRPHQTGFNARAI